MSLKISIINYKDGEICEVAGWGATDDSTFRPQHLREAQVEIWNLAQCKNQYVNCGASKEITDVIAENTTICAGAGAKQRNVNKVMSIMVFVMMR